MTDTPQVPPDRRTRPRTERRKPRLSTSAGEVPHAIQWHEGMLLVPQHFQWLSRRADTLVHYHTSSIAPFYWGVKHLQLDTPALTGGVVRVVELEAVMPDGLVVSHTASSGHDLKLSLKDHLEGIRKQPLKIHLAIAVRGNDIPLEERYASTHSDPVSDENLPSRESEQPVPLLVPKLQLLAGDPPNRFISFPLLEIEYRNEVLTQTEFSPPWVRISAESGIYRLCNALATLLRQKADFLRDQIRASSSNVGAAQTLDVKSMVHSLVAGLPGFEALLRSGASHPFQLYIALCEIVGHVASVGLSPVPPPLDPYDHDDLFATFSQAVGFIEQSVSEGVHEQYRSHEFLWTGSEFRLLMEKVWLDYPMFLGVRTAHDSTDAATDSWIENAAIASQSNEATVRAMRLRGVPRPRSSGQSDLVPPRGTMLYELRPSEKSESREAIVPNEDLVISNTAVDERGRPDRIVLYVKKEKRSS